MLTRDQLVIDDSKGKDIRLYVRIAALKLLFEMAVSRGLLDKVPDLTLF